MERKDSAQQRLHYHKIHDAYEAHYFDPASMRYRARFIFDPLLAGLDLRGRRVADVACGSGFSSVMLEATFRRTANGGLRHFGICVRALQEHNGRTRRIG